MRILILACLALCIALAYANDSAESIAVEPPAAEYYLPPTTVVKQSEAEEPATNVNENGYSYRTVRRLKYRHRRELSQEYLPPATAYASASEPSQEYLPPDNSVDTPVGADGYRYKTIRRLRYRARNRRDVSEISAPSNEYLPPAELKTVVDDNGYRYRTVRRLKFRRQRREAEAAEYSIAAPGAPGADGAPGNDYLPPNAEDAPATKSADSAASTEVQSAKLASDGYRYKTVRRIRYRYRH